LPSSHLSNDQGHKAASSTSLISPVLLRTKSLEGPSFSINNQKSTINNILLYAFVVKNGEKRKAPQKGRLNAE
jgi:hypothetical protein